MSNELQIFNYNSNEVRVVEKDGEPWFVGKDVAQALGYARTERALKLHVDEEDKLTLQFGESGQRRDMVTINEAGLYSLIFSSKLESAKKFKHWVTHEVLPDIRKHGMYLSDKAVNAYQGCETVSHQV